MSDWPPIIFHFGTENWEEQLKSHPVQIHIKKQMKGLYLDAKSIDGAEIY